MGEHHGHDGDRDRVVEKVQAHPHDALQSEIKEIKSEVSEIKSAVSEINGTLQAVLSALAMKES